MPITVTMPRLSDTMEQGTVVTWHVKEGDTVSQGDVLADIETDKATMELESFDDGTVAKLAAQEGQKVAVGETILVIAEEGEDAEEAAKSAGSGASAGSASKSEGSGAKSEGSGEDKQQSEKSESSTAVADREAEGTDPDEQAGGDGGEEPSDEQASEQRGSGDAPAEPKPSSNGVRVFASPLARKVAAERGITLSTIQGTGPGGRITRKDVESASAAPAAPARAERTGKREGERPAAPISMPAPAAQLESKSVSLNNMRETIAKRLQESKSTIPHYQVTVSVRLDTLMELREQLNGQLESQGVKLSVNDFLVRACALAMHQHPFVNSSWNPKGPKIDLHGNVNIGVAVALPEERGGGLVVATLRDADRTGLRQISSETKRLAKKAREKGLSVEDMSDTTFTISNLGMFGVEHFTAIINPPNAAILAVGRAIEKPFVEYDENGEAVLTVGHEMSMTISCDHRVIDGAMAAQYLGTVKELLENPAALLV